MSVIERMELINVLSPDLYLREVPPELSYFRVRVFYPKILGKAVLSLDAHSKLIATLDDVPDEHIDIVAKALFLGLERGLLAGLHKTLSDASDFDDRIPF